MLVENATYSDLEPLSAPFWSLRVKLRDRLSCFLADLLEKFMELQHVMSTPEKFIGRAESMWKNFAEYHMK